MKVNKKLYNIIVMGIGFMFVFTAFQTMGMIEKTLLDSIKTENSNFSGDAYSSLALIYAIFAIGNWITPSFLAYTGARAAMVIGAGFYSFFVITFVLPRTWLLYVASAAVGIGSAITWTGQGAFLSRCSSATTIVRNTGIFWALFQMSQIIGNLYIYFEFGNIGNHIDSKTRIFVITILSGSSILGMIILTFLRYIPDELESDKETAEKDLRNGLKNAAIAFTSAMKLFLTKNMLLLSVTFFYIGAELSFYSGVYCASIGFTLQLSDSPKQIVGLAGFFIGLGGLCGAGLSSMLGNRLTKIQQSPVILIGLIVHLFSFIMIALNLPNNSPFKDTMDIGIFDKPLVWLALLCGFLLGFGDACFNTQIFSLLASGKFAKYSVSAFALFNFFKSIGAATCFFYSSYLGLQVQLGILIVLSLLATGCFCYVKKEINIVSTRKEIPVNV